MSSTSAAMDSRASEGLARAALIVGVLAILTFIGLGFVEDWFFVLGLVIGVIGVGLGLAARRRTPSRMATAAIVLSAIPVVWFIVYMIVDAIA